MASSSLSPIVAAKTHIGRIRPWNEDTVSASISPSNNCALLIVADGMGGFQNNEVVGKVASQLLVDTIYQELKDLLQPSRPKENRQENLKFDRKQWENHHSKRLLAAVEKANLVLYEHIKRKQADNQEFRGTSALVCAFVQDNLAVIANVGDCRVYHLRDDQLHLITTNYPIQLIGPPYVVLSYGNYLGWVLKTQVNRLSPSVKVEVADDEKGKFMSSVQIYLWAQSLQAGDQLLLCSDGIWGEILDDAQLAEHLIQSATPKEAVERLIDAANTKGGHDNIAVIVCEMIQN